MEEIKMEFEKYYETSVREAYRRLRKSVIEGSKLNGQRYRLLAYAFVRGRKYNVLESKTEADNLCAKGQHTYFMHIANMVAHQMNKAFNPEKPLSVVDTRQFIYDWMQEDRLKAPVEENAAQEAAQ